jgi:hypothetical protein
MTPMPWAGAWFRQQIGTITLQRSIKLGDAASGFALDRRQISTGLSTSLAGLCRDRKSQFAKRLR